jgi:hypothetical protein
VEYQYLIAAIVWVAASAAPFCVLAEKDSQLLSAKEKSKLAVHTGEEEEARVRDRTGETSAFYSPGNRALIPAFAPKPILLR